MTTAIVPQPTLTLSELRNPDAAAKIIYFFGLEDLPNPPRRGQIDSWPEPEPVYVDRVWPTLENKLKSQALVIGLQKAAAYREALSDGIQLVCWRAYINGWYVPTQEGEGDDKSFRLWVRNAVTADGASDTEGHQLASTILNLHWLSANGYPGIPGDPEEIFQSRESYARWRRVASKLRGLIQAYEDWEEPETGDLEELDEAIEDTIKTVNDPEKSFDDLDEAGTTKSRAPRVTIELTGYDDLGRHRFEGAATQTQLNLLRNDTKRHAAWKLRGEETVDEYVLVRYRHIAAWVCPDCGLLFGAEGRDCIGCGYEGDLTKHHRWSRQVWSGEWSEFEDCEEPILNGNQEGVPLVDTELGLTYIAQWEEADVPTSD